MANHKSAKKRAKQTDTRQLINKRKSSRMRTMIKKLRLAISENDKKTASELLPKTQSLINKMAKSSALKKETASRKTSRFAAQVASI